MSLKSLSCTSVRVGLVSVIIAMLGCLSAPSAHADLSLSVMPGLIDLHATPGATGAQEIVVSNSGTEAFTASVVIEPVASAPAERSSVG